MRIKTYVTKPDEVQRNWWVIDARGLTLGRLASAIAPILKGKHKPTYAPNLDAGDYVIVINCERIRVTGQKMDAKMYYRYSGYPGGLTAIALREMLAKHPERVIEHAVAGMLPKTGLGKKMLKKLKVYAGETHPHAAQNPQPLEVRER
jgi:large subunit ribosomal protein L13